MKIKADIHTAGNGCWSKQERSVHCYKFDIAYLSGDFGELRVYFTKRSWNPMKYGLIYTDTLWLKEFRTHLVSIGFSPGAAKNVDYSEQGMQGHNYVSLDFGKKFYSEWKKLT